MTALEEDSGAFKTNPGNSAQFGHFVITPAHGEYPAEGRLRRVSARKSALQPEQTGQRPDLELLYSGFSLIRGGEGGSLSVLTAFPVAP